MFRYALIFFLILKSVQLFGQPCGPRLEYALNTVAFQDRVFVFADYLKVSCLRSNGETIFETWIELDLPHDDHRLYENTAWYKRDEFLTITAFPTTQKGVVALATVYRNYSDYAIITVEANGKFIVEDHDLINECKAFKTEDTFNYYLYDQVESSLRKYFIHEVEFKAAWDRRMLEINKHFMDKPQPGTFIPYWPNKSGGLSLGCNPTDSIEFLTNSTREWQMKLPEMVVAEHQGNRIFIPLIERAYGYMTVIEEVKGDCMNLTDHVVSIIKFEQQTGKIIWKQRCFRRI